MEEGRRLQRISRTAKDAVRLRRAIVVMMSAQGQSVPDITSLMQVSADCVRDVIRAFNEQGFEALDPKGSGGRPRMISSQVREHICLIARTSPADWNLRVLHLEPDQARRTPGQAERGPRRQPRDTATDTARGQGLLADQHDLEVLERPRLHRHDAPDSGALRLPADRRPGGLCGRVRAAQPHAPQRQGMAPAPLTTSSAGHLQPLRRRDAHACRPRPGHQKAAVGAYARRRNARAEPASPPARPSRPG
ncbi:transposase [Streptomyces sp. B3I7]|uniref:helix-turn-helix domain-containing protein n=1 Tax=Streptomyces sp. B3I7 TaxID=3042269 RepID=UPI00358F5150